MAKSCMWYSLTSPRHSRVEASKYEHAPPTNRQRHGSLCSGRRLHRWSELQAAYGTGTSGIQRDRAAGHSERIVEAGSTQRPGSARQMVGDLQRFATEWAGRESRHLQPDIEGGDGAILLRACSGAGGPRCLLSDVECRAIDFA